MDSYLTEQTMIMKTKKEVVYRRTDKNVCLFTHIHTFSLFSTSGFIYNSGPYKNME